jgi:hypothetical protein
LTSIISIAAIVLARVGAFGQMQRQGHAIFTEAMPG